MEISDPLVEAIAGIVEDVLQRGILILPAAGGWMVTLADSDSETDTEGAPVASVSRSW